MTRNTPILNVSHPVEKVLLRRKRADGDFLLLDGFHGGFCHIIHLHPPLRLEHRLNNILTLLATGDNHRIVLPLDVETSLLELLNDSISGIESPHTRKGTAVVFEGTVIVQLSYKLVSTKHKIKSGQLTIDTNSRPCCFPRA